MNYVRDTDEYRKTENGFPIVQIGSPKNSKLASDIPPQWSPDTRSISSKQFFQKERDHKTTHLQTELS